MSALALASLLLAWASWRWVEAPFRHKGTFDRRQVFTFSLVGSLCFLAVGAVGHWQQGFAQRFALPPAVAQQFERDEPRIAECYAAAQLHKKPNWLCEFGAGGVPVSFLLVGDSHARAILPAFEAAAQQAGQRFAFTATSACPPLQLVHAVKRQQDDISCHGLNQRVLAYAKASGIRRVVLVGRWSGYAHEGASPRESLPIGLSPQERGTPASSRAAFNQGLAATVQAYAEAGIELWWVPQVPEQVGLPRSIYYRVFDQPEGERAASLRAASPTRDQHRRLQAYVERSVAPHVASGRLKLLSFEPVLCNEQLCPVGDEQAPFYADDNHLSRAGAARLVPTLTAALKAAAAH